MNYVHESRTQTMYASRTVYMRHIHKLFVCVTNYGILAVFPADRLVDTINQSNLCTSHELCVCVTNCELPAVFPSDRRVPPKKPLGCRVSTPYTLFCLICSINSELNDSAIFTHLSEPGLISADFQWTGSTPSGFQEGFRAGYND